MSGYLVLTAAILAGCAVFCLFVKWHYRNRISATYQELLQKLDKAIGGEIQDTVYDESMDAAVAERLNRVVRISGMNQGKAERERDLIKSLISDISHQVRTPVTNIMLYAGLLQELDLDADAMRLADKIQKQSDKLDFFMKELVKSSYAEQEMIAIHPVMTGVEEIVNTACQMVELAALKKKINIVQEETKSYCYADKKRTEAYCYADKKRTEAYCYADKKWTIEALGNVLDNAVKYSPENSEVTVGVIPYESFICIQVKDQGIGIREEEQGMVFDRFYRSGDVSGEPGFGIGLYLAREVLVKQGGYVKIRSEIGKGTVIQLFLSRYEV